MGAKLMQVKQIIKQVEEEIDEINCVDDKINADLLKTKKAMAYEQIRSVVVDA
jgi:hypothetical protein